MGEIGYPEHAFLQELQWWQIRAIIRGYRKRERSSWMQTRIMAYAIKHMMGGDPEDFETFMPLPWDKPAKTQEEIKEDQRALEELVAECQRQNEQLNIQKDGNNR